jgi:hypothetical protein
MQASRRKIDSRHELAAMMFCDFGIMRHCKKEVIFINSCYFLGTMNNCAQKSFQELIFAFSKYTPSDLENPHSPARLAMQDEFFAMYRSADLAGKANLESSFRNGIFAKKIIPNVEIAHEGLLTFETQKSQPFALSGSIGIDEIDPQLAHLYRKADSYSFSAQAKISLDQNRLVQLVGTKYNHPDFDAQYNDWRGDYAVMFIDAMQYAAEQFNVGSQRRVIHKDSAVFWAYSHTSGKKKNPNIFFEIKHLDISIDYGQNGSTEIGVSKLPQLAREIRDFFRVVDTVRKGLFVAHHVDVANFAHTYAFKSHRFSDTTDHPFSSSQLFPTDTRFDFDDDEDSGEEWKKG